jgi:hypothetical protein
MSNKITSASGKQIAIIVKICLKLNISKNKFQLIKLKKILHSICNSNR